MYRASTPQMVFLFDFDPDALFKKILITFVQDGSIVMEKTKDDLIFEQEESEGETVYKASFRMTQEETKQFSGKKPNVSLQIRFLDLGDHVITSPIVRLRVTDVLNDEVLV